jgi:hypothetical protein
LSTTEYKTLRRIILYGKRTKHRVAALTDLIGSPTPPSARLLDELLRQKNLSDEFALTVLSVKRTLYGESNAPDDSNAKSPSS